ncbi:MAG: hypothetical protein AB8G77_26355 [Rhodothermales bacterium]
MYAHVRLSTSLIVFLLFPLFSGCFLSGDEDQQMLVVEYSGEPFTAEDVYKKWEFDVEENIVSIQQVVEPDAIESRVYYLKLEHIAGELPKVLDVWYGPQGGGISQGTRAVGVAIQSWNIDGEVSGYIELISAIGVRRGARFWGDLSVVEN